MEHKFKNRLMGLIFVIMISIIILPIFLNGNKYNKTEFARIPLMPQFKEVNNTASIAEMKSTINKNILKNITKEKIFEEKSSEKFNKDSELYQKKTNTNKTKTQIKKNTLLINKNTNQQDTFFHHKPKNTAYIIQLGVFRNSVTVQEILNKLRIYGYQVYTKSSFQNNNQLTHIFIGPNLSKKKLQMNLSKLKDLTGLDGKIYIYKA
ncbi:MAG: SPOR domain-containing protein [Arsenophonus sp.]|nr:MAG: SPOR domain-containing protein [Arsenophonus sp.]